MGKTVEYPSEFKIKAIKTYLERHPWSGIEKYQKCLECKTQNV